MFLLRFVNNVLRFYVVFACGCSVCAATLESAWVDARQPQGYIERLDPCLFSLEDFVSDTNLLCVDGQWFGDGDLRVLYYPAGCTRGYSATYDVCDLTYGILHNFVGGRRALIQPVRTMLRDQVLQGVVLRAGSPRAKVQGATFGLADINPAHYVCRPFSSQILCDFLERCCPKMLALDEPLWANLTDPVIQMMPFFKKNVCWTIELNQVLLQEVCFRVRQQTPTVFLLLRDYVVLKGVVCDTPINNVRSALDDKIFGAKDSLLESYHYTDEGWRNSVNYDVDVSMETVPWVFDPGR